MNELSSTVEELRSLQSRVRRESIRILVKLGRMTPQHVQEMKPDDREQYYRLVVRFAATLLMSFDAISNYTRVGQITQETFNAEEAEMRIRAAGHDVIVRELCAVLQNIPLDKRSPLPTPGHSAGARPS